MTTYVGNTLGIFPWFAMDFQCPKILGKLVHYEYLSLSKQHQSIIPQKIEERKHFVVVCRDSQLVRK